jgi:hypothetical protein
MQDSLAGGSKVVMLLAVNPSDKDASETLSSLNFAARLRGLELGPVQRNFKPAGCGRQKELLQQLDTANADVADALLHVHELEEQVAQLQEQLADQEVLPVACTCVAFMCLYGGISVELCRYLCRPLRLGKEIIPVTLLN